jgi:signal transduction histidine kinase
MVAAQEEERQRWSAELHDRTGANLAAINMNLKAIAKAIPQPDAEDHELLTETSALIGDTIVSIRDFCNALRPALLEYAGLVPALQDAADRFARHAGVQMRFDHAAFEGRCDAETELMLFRITQEALLNCAKHAQARHVTIVLSGTPQRLALRIEDDGLGFDTNLVSAGRPGIGHGLLNMRERALFAGGTLAIESAPGEGTRVVVVVGPAPPSVGS